MYSKSFALDKATSSTEVHLLHLDIDVSVEVENAELHIVHFSGDVKHEREAGTE